MLASIVCASHILFFISNRIFLFLFFVFCDVFVYSFIRLFVYSFSFQIENVKTWNPKKKYMIFFNTKLKQYSRYYQKIKNGKKLNKTIKIKSAIMFDCMSDWKKKVKIKAYMIMLVQYSGFILYEIQSYSVWFTFRWAHRPNVCIYRYS